MTETSLTPGWLRIAAAVVVGETLVRLIADPSAPFRVAAVGVAVLLAWLLLRGSRVAWVLVAFGSAAQFATSFTMDQPMWFGGFAAVVLICLLAPSSRRFVWTDRDRQAGGPLRPAAQRSYSRLLVLPYNVESRVVEKGTALVNRKVIARLAVWVALLILLAGALSVWHDGSGRDNVIVFVLWKVTWIWLTLAQVALIALLAMAAYNYVIKRRQRLKT